jgi:hypothetical protein
VTFSKLLVVAAAAAVNSVACGGSDFLLAPDTTPVVDASAGGDAGGASPDSEGGGAANDAPVAEGGAGQPCLDGGSCAVGLSCVAMANGEACAPPQGPMVTDKGGPVLDAMEVWTVVWTGDEATGSTVDQFNAAALQSAWWQGASEYGVGPGQAMGVIVAGSPPATLAADGSDYDALISGFVGTTTLDGEVVPPPNRNTVFAFIVPTQTRAPGGGYYHTTTNYEVTSANGNAIYVPYIVDLQSSITAGVPYDEDYLTWSHSHELVETATDPATPSLAWTSASTGGNSEIADLCNDIPVTVAVGGAMHWMSRFWSATIAAARTGDPCIPATPGPFANVALGSDVVNVPSGISGVSVQLVPFAYGDPKPVHWQLYMTKNYQASPTEGTNSPGDEVMVTFTRKDSVPQPAEYLLVWVTDPSHPNAPIPSAEWFGGLTPSP